MFHPYRLVLICLFSVLFWVGFSQNAKAAATLCKPTEHVLLSCTMDKSQKTLSLCGLQPSESQAGYIAYRFGTAQKIELEYPKDKNDSFNLFTYSTYFRGGGKQNAGLDLVSIFFTNESTQYEIFSNWSAEDEKTTHGVIVSDETETTLQCREPAIDNIHGGKTTADWIFLKIQKR